MTDPRSLQLKAMKGSDLKVLISMALLGSINIGNQAIKQFCGLSYPTIASCLINLSGMDLVTKTHRTDGWQLTQGGRQMLLPVEPSTKLLHSEPSSSSNIILNDLKIKDITTTTKEPSEKKHDSEIRKALNDLGIFDPKAIDMASLEHITLEYIKSWELALKFKRVGKGGDDIPLAIYKMGNNHLPPTVPKEYLESDTCHICGDSAWDHGGRTRCNGRHYYTFGKRDTCNQCNEVTCICCGDCLEYPCECDEPIEH